MPNDVITLQAISKELNDRLSGGRIEKIYQPETDEITISIKKTKMVHTLVVSANPSHPRIHITTQKKENSYTAPAFCMLLRKYLTGSFIESIKLFNNDRIIKIDIVQQTELKDVCRIFLIVELMGRYSNIILTNDNYKIIDAIRRIHFDQSTTRYILPKLDYTLQPQTRITLNQTEKINEFFLSPQSTDEIIKKIGGISKESASEIATAGNQFEKIQEMIDIYERNTYSPCLRYEKGILKDYYVMPYSSVSGEYVLYPSLNEALDDFYRLYDGAERKKASTKTITTVLKRLQTKTERRINDNKSKLAESEKANELKKMGELIFANLYRIKQGDTILSCYDYYTNNTIDILLDPTLSPTLNGQSFYKKYAKMKRASEIAQEQLNELYAQQEYLKTIAVSIENCSLKSEYDEILTELNSLSGLRNINKKKFVKEKSSKPTKLTINGFDVYLGKNNLQNNEVTFNIANGGDMWFHIKNQPGSHLIVKGKPDEETIVTCASIVAFYSSAKTSEKVEVDYTLRKNVKKIPSSLPGMVTYTNYRSVLVHPKSLDDILK